ncbi:FAD/NAD(P)-binding domain-containing protein [Ascobolus immersus RN42]|uniref:FAD/NAD(P)-binding domain-containing protein n=1 Tax=Ascobolus immersus RN42 TaxID=1160509 RepID=A0A3N4I1D5_ASCIM|nr:FAD/NAD(P)-binding domain-containing protein [Ascobolus immersus RN42]
MSEKKQSVAIVGSGLAGLTAARLLADDPAGRYDVHIYEIGPTPSFAAASLSLPHPSGHTEPVDIPMRALSAGYYDRVFALYRRFGVQFRKLDFLFAFTRQDSSGSYFIHASGNHRFPPKPTGKSWLSHLWDLLCVALVYAWYAACLQYFPPHVAETHGTTESLRQYTERVWLPTWFTADFLLPLLSSVTTCPHETLLEYPAVDFAGYKTRTAGKGHYVVDGGVGNIQSRLMYGIPTTFNAMVTSITHLPSGKIELSWKNTKSGEEHLETVDKVILAINPSVIARIYPTLAPQMEKIPCLDLEVVAHTDESLINLMPASGGESGALLEGKMSIRAAAALEPNEAHIVQLRTTTVPTSGHMSSRILRGGKQPREELSHITESTHIHNPTNVFFTTIPLSPIDSSLESSRAKFTRVLRTAESRSIVNSIFHGERREKEWKNGDGGVWLCGGWCWDGMVLLEGCVVSAEEVARGLGVVVPN